MPIGKYSFNCLLEKCIRTPGGILTKTDKGYALLCLGGGASVDCWEINDATAKPHKLTPTLKQNRSQCARRPHRPKPSVQTMKGQVVIRPSLVLNIIMRHCEPCWHGCRCFPLPSVFLWGQLDDELFFCSLAQHDTFNSPDGPHHDSVSRLVCCWAACTGQWNIIHTLELGFTWWKISSHQHRTWFFFPSMDYFQGLRRWPYESWRQIDVGGCLGLLLNRKFLLLKVCFKTTILYPCRD